MKTIQFILVVMLLTGCQSEGCIQEERVPTANEKRLLLLVEPYVVSASARLLSQTTQESWRQNIDENEMIEEEIATLGISRTDVGTESLVNLLGVRIGARGGKELDCQILDRGKSILLRLEGLEANKLAEHCREIFFEQRKGKLKSVHDVPVESICRSAEEIDNKRRSLIQAIKKRGP
jgi:hypothetical protein